MGQAQVERDREDGVAVGQLELGVVEVRVDPIVEAERVFQRLLEVAQRRDRSANGGDGGVEGPEQVEADSVERVPEQVVEALADERERGVPGGIDSISDIRHQVFGLPKRLAGEFDRVNQAETDQPEGGRFVIEQEGGRNRRATVSRHSEQSEDLPLGIGVVDQAPMVHGRASRCRRDFEQHGVGRTSVVQSGEPARGRVGGYRAVAARGAVSKLVPGLRRGGESPDHIGEGQDFVLQAQAEHRAGMADGQVGRIHRGAIYYIGPRGRADKGRRARGVQIEQEAVAAIHRRQNREQLRRIVDVIEERIGREQVVQGGNVLVDELDLGREGGVADHAAVRVADAGAGLHHLVGVADEVGQEAGGRLEAEVVRQHPKRRAGALVRHAGLDQGVDRQQAPAAGVGRALEVAAGNQAPGAVRDQVHRRRDRPRQVVPCICRLVQPVSQVVHPGIEAVERVIRNRGRRDVREHAVLRPIGRHRHRHPPIPQRHVERAVHPGLVRPVGVPDIDQRLHDVRIGLLEGLQHQLGRINPPRQIPIVNRVPREGGIHERPAEPRDEQHRPVDRVLHILQRRRRGRGRHINRHIKPRLAIERHRRHRPARHQQRVVPAPPLDRRRQRVTGAHLEAIRPAAASQGVHLAERDRRRTIRADRARIRSA